MNEMANPFIVDFPMEGEWFAPNTPAASIPSHGTDALGQRYAYDFMMADWLEKGKKLYRGKSWSYYLIGKPLSQWYGWGQDVFAPCNGRIITAKDGMKERQRVHLLKDLFTIYKNALFFDPRKDSLQHVCGNYIIIQTESTYMMLAHLQKGSICVSEGQDVKAGMPLGRVGHSGNSTGPHLHFQLMDSPNLFTAKGLPCAFRNYEKFSCGKWEEIHCGIPSNNDRIRNCIHHY